MHRGFLEEVTAPSAHVVSVLWVVEHLLDPAGFLADLSYRAHTLLLAVPNEWTPQLLKASAKAAVPYWWIDKTHVNYFRRADIERLLHRTGWKIQHEMGTFPMEALILLGQDYTADPELGARLHAGVRKTDLAMTSLDRRLEYTERARTAQCRDLILICESEHS